MTGLVTTPDRLTDAFQETQTLCELAELPLCIMTMRYPPFHRLASTPCHCRLVRVDSNALGRSHQTCPADIAAVAWHACRGSEGESLQRRTLFYAVPRANVVLSSEGSWKHISWTRTFLLFLQDFTAGFYGHKCDNKHHRVVRVSPAGVASRFFSLCVTRTD